MFKEYIFIDLETTGLPRRGDCSNVWVTEIACLICDADLQPVSAKQALVRLPDNVLIHPEAEKVSGISREECQANGLPIREAIHIIMEAYADLNTPVVGHNLYGFDIPIMHALLGRLGMQYEQEVTWALTVIDTMLTWRAWKLGLQSRPWERDEMFFGRVMTAQYWGGSSLEHVARELGVIAPGDQQVHRALYDCELTRLVFEAMRNGGILAATIDAGD